MRFLTAISTFIDKTRAAFIQGRGFLTTDIWLLQAKQVDHHWWLVRVYRFFASIVFAFRNNRFALHASALTYYTLMSIVPVFALGLTLARAFGADDLAKQRTLLYMDRWLGQIPQAVTDAATKAVADGTVSAAESTAAVEGAEAAAPMIAGQLRDVVNDLFDQIGQLDMKTIGGVGAIILIFMVITVLSRVEDSFNMIWSVETSRSIWRKFSDYLSVVILFPFFLLAATSVPVVELVARTTDNVFFFGPYLRMLIESAWMKHLIVGTVVTLGFTFVLVFMPNTRVRFVAGLAGGLFTAVCFVAWLVLCARLQIGVTKYDTLYGGFALVPILLLWIYTSWLIVLIGAELTFAVQNGDTCHLDAAHGLSMRARFLLAAALCREAGACVQRGSAPFNPVDYARKIGVSVRFAMYVVDDLARGKWLMKVDPSGENYLPSRDFNTLTLADLATWLYNNGYSLKSLGLDDLEAPLLRAGDSIEAALKRELALPLVDAPGT